MIQVHQAQLTLEMMNGMVFWKVPSLQQAALAQEQKIWIKIITHLK